MNRSLRTAVTTLLAVALMAMAAPALAADSGAEAEFVALLNAERASRGLPELTVSSDLVAVAREHSQRMGDKDDLHHNPNLGNDVSDWKKVGENVGRGPRVAAIHDAFMASPGHKGNILDSDWTQVGIGVVVVDGQIWVTQLFRLPKGATAPPPEPKPEPKPEVTEEPAPAPAKDEQPTRTKQPAPAPAAARQAPAPVSTTASQAAPAPAPAPEPQVPTLADVMLEVIG